MQTLLLALLCNIGLSACGDFIEKEQPLLDSNKTEEPRGNTTPGASDTSSSNTPLTPAPTPKPEESDGPKENWPPPPPKEIPAGEHILGDPNRLEIPRLAGGPKNYFVTHTTEDGIVNYSVEYDVDKRNPRWVAFVFDDQTAARNYTKRSDAWQWNPKIPGSYSTDGWYTRSGYSRGHMVASSDRYYSKEANIQTFYYTNAMPQLQSHNGGIWNKLESKIQAWGRDSKWRDTLYIARGGTIHETQIEQKKIRGHMVIPKYFFMAMVRRHKGKLSGIAFWTEHREYPRNTSLASLAISIDELEKRTGIDFFHNFDDKEENQFEAQEPDNRLWSGLNK